ncbi:sodium channel modifier 1-like [Durio zibethinus]|uniref:Sodium channel modifier 1 n=1 Tax=Durio zibethinus TaxID=66656 RepID=A0A6P6AEP8_DURZI|nr:sodium channel modifier 1-like [Durio zibethinus]
MLLNPDEEAVLKPKQKRRVELERGRKMSVFGGDSWGREAQYRKRRIDEVVIEGVDDSSYKKLSSGKYACLVCPHNPIFDTPLMLSMHCKGSRHRAAESKMKEKELMRLDEINKRIALSNTPTSSVNSSATKQNAHLASKPLIQMAQKAASEILSDKTPKHNLRNENHDMVLRQNDIKYVTPDFCQSQSFPANETSNELLQKQLDFQERRERELKFTSAGWKRDGHGKWYKDENVEFDSDEEDPNSSV